jgi:RNA 2',3'-cyclic 3'-phosphodiesterase
MQDHIRAFIAVEINEAVREKLAGVQDELREAGGHVSWVKPQNIHSTLVFLGDLFSDSVSAVADALVKATSACKPFEMEIRGLGYFGSPRSPRIVWSGIASPGVVGGATPLVELQNAMLVAVLATGLKPDTKPFKPHFTIGRVRSNRNAAALVGMIEAKEDESFGKVAVQRVVLMKSILSAQGPEYSIVQAAAFGAK